MANTNSSTASPKTVQYLVSDIGGTNARFALIGDQGQWLDRITVPTSAFDEGSNFAKQLLTEFFPTLQPGALEAICIAMAGPVTDRQGVLSNAGLRLDANELSRIFQCPVFLVNDFYALAHWIPACEQLIPIGGGTYEDGPKLVLGPGTGFGCAALFPQPDGQWQVAASEAGHTDFAPRGLLELELARFLELEIPHPCWEALVSGPGLVNLYRALASVWGEPPRPQATPEWITSMGIEAEVPLCHQTLETFCTLLAGLAGNLALIYRAVGGVYITGGVIAGLQNFIATKAVAGTMRRRFEDRGILSDYVSAIPLAMVCDEDPGLRGAATVLRQRLSV